MDFIIFLKFGVSVYVNYIPASGGFDGLGWRAGKLLVSLKNNVVFATITRRAFSSVGRALTLFSWERSELENKEYPLGATDSV